MKSEKREPPIGWLLAKLRNSKFWETESHATVLESHRHGDAARPRQRGHRSDGAQAISKSTHARGLWPHPFLRLALSARRKTQSGIRPKFPSLQRRIGSAYARELWLRLQPRTRPLGREGLRLPSHCRAELRRHFLQQLFQERHPSRHASRGTNRRAFSARGKRRRLFAYGESAESDHRRQTRLDVQI